MFFTLTIYSETHLYSSSYASLVICICATKLDPAYTTPKTNSVQACVNANTSSISYAVPKSNAKCNSWCNANAHSQCCHKGCYYRLSSSLIIMMSFATFDFSRPVNYSLVFLNFSRYFMNFSWTRVLINACTNLQTLLEWLKNMV